jgi:6-phosphogluconate dehydrogenase (decarboxylating)
VDKQRYLTEWQQFLKQINDRVIDDGKPQWSVEEALAEQELFAPQGVS